MKLQEARKLIWRVAYYIFSQNGIPKDMTTERVTLWNDGDFQITINHCEYELIYHKNLITFGTQTKTFWEVKV